MTRSALIERVSERVEGLTLKQTEIVIDTVFESIKNALEKGEKVEIRGFGNFRLKERKPRKARNPKTGESVDVPGKNELFATSIVGARIKNSPDSRQFRISAVSIVVAAVVDFAFFLEINKNNSRINRRPDSGSYAPKTAATKSVTHGRHTSPIIGLPGASTIRRQLNTSSADRASLGNSGGNGISDSRATTRRAQSGHAVVHGVTS